MKRIKITAIAENGSTHEWGWQEEKKGEEFAREMTARGYVVVKQYR